MTEMAAESQFIEEAAGTYLEGISSVTYNQMTAPIVEAYPIIKKFMSTKAMYITA